MALRIEVLPDPEAVAERAAEFVAGQAGAAIADHGRFTFAVSGGHTPWAMFAQLAGMEMPWEQVTIFQVDERVAPDGDPDRNLTHLRQSLPAGAAADVRPMPVSADDLERAADEYARSLPEAFDLIHLGLGPDGHTASLVPGDPVLEVMDRDVAVTGVYQGRRRMTLTYPVLDRAPNVLWLVTGEDKVDALRRLRGRRPLDPRRPHLQRQCGRDRGRSGHGPSRPMNVEREKQIAAEAAALLVEEGMAVGLGTGSTVAYLLPALAARRLDLRCVATSPATEQAARELAKQGRRLAVFLTKTYTRIVNRLAELDPNLPTEGRRSARARALS